MKKSKALRLAGFAGALCASGALLGTSISGTGAYFTDSHSGSINAGTGAIAVTVSPQSGQLNFDNLLPGEYQTRTISYTAHPKGGTEDVWLVLPGTTDGSPDAFTGTPAPGAKPLGRYGHFAVTSSAGASFTSYNLAKDPNGYNTAQSCYIDANGNGGSNDQPKSPTDTQTAKYCAPRPAILLQSDMKPGDQGSADLTFGFTPLLTNNAQNLDTAPVEAFKIVATQHGVRPDDQFNG